MSLARPEREWWRRGHRIVRFADGRWRWAATGRFLIMGAHPTDPPCTVCDLPPTPEGHDPCLGTLEGVTSACCGARRGRRGLPAVRGRDAGCDGPARLTSSAMSLRAIAWREIRGARRGAGR
jgi:hypothetical protein